MSPSSGKGMRPEAVSVRLGVHLKKVIFLLNQYALHLQQQWTLVGQTLRKMADGTEMCRRASPINLPAGSVLYHVSSPATNALSTSSILSSTLPLGWSKDIDPLSLPFQMWRWDHLTNPGLLVIWKFALDQKSHSMVCIHLSNEPSPVLSQQQSNTVQNRGLDYTFSKQKGLKSDWSSKFSSIQT